MGVLFSNISLLFSKNNLLRILRQKLGYNVLGKLVLKIRALRTFRLDLISKHEIFILKDLTMRKNVEGDYWNF